MTRIAFPLGGSMSFLPYEGFGFGATVGARGQLVMLLPFLVVTVEWPKTGARG